MNNFLTWALAAFIVYVLFFARSENEAYAYDDAEFYADDSVVAEYFGEVPDEHFGFFSSVGDFFKKGANTVASVAKKGANTVASVAKPALGVAAGMAGGKVAIAAGLLGGGRGGGAAAGGGGPVNVGPFNIQCPCPSTKWNELSPQNVISIAIMLVLMILAVRSFRM